MPADLIQKALEAATVAVVEWTADYASDIHNDEAAKAAVLAFLKTLRHEIKNGPMEFVGATYPHELVRDIRAGVLTFLVARLEKP